MSATLSLHLPGELAGTSHAALVPSVVHTAVEDPQPSDNDVVAGWTAAVVFVLLILGLVVICRSLVTRLKNVDRAAEEGLYDPSDEKRQRPARGLAARRPPTS